jgi:L-rhamnose isomerase
MKAVMISLLEPTELLKEAEEQGKLGNRLALQEEFKSLPFGAVWDMYCVKNGVPAGAAWVDEVNSYEEKVLAKR